MSLENIVNKTLNNLRGFGSKLASSGRSFAYSTLITLTLTGGLKANTETKYIDIDPTGQNNSSSWVTPHNNLQDEFAVNSIETHFVAQPELGYVIKLEEKTGISTFSETLGLYGAKDIKPIKGVDRKGVSVVYSNLNAIENEEIIKMLRTNHQVKYAAPLFSSNGETVAIIPEIVVRVTPETNTEQLQSLCETIGLTIKKKMEYTNTEYLIKVLGNNVDAVFAGIEQLNQASFIEWAAPNIAFQPRFCGQFIPNDPYFHYQWHLHSDPPPRAHNVTVLSTNYADINAPEAWEITTGDPNIVVAVLDTGVDYNHEDLKANIWKNLGEIPNNGIDDDGNGFIDDLCGWDFYDNDNSPDPLFNYPDDTHGTTCAGLVAAQGNNSIGVTGVAWNCKIMPIRISSADNYVTHADIAESIRYAAKNGADVLNCSWGTLGSDMPIVHSAIKDVTVPGGIGREGKGCVFLAGSGNNAEWFGERYILFPARFPEVIAVGATNQLDMVWDYSGYGSELELVAPSGDIDLKGNIWTTDISGSAGWNNRHPGVPSDYLDRMGGTSAACAIISGVAALTLSANPNLTALEVRRILSRSAKDLGERGWDKYYGNGRIDAYAAVTLASNPPEPTVFVDDNALNDPLPYDPNISDLLENGSAEHPFDTLQEAINMATPGDTVIVLPGIYNGKGNHDIEFRGKAITVRSKDGPQTCIIDCQKLSRGFSFHADEGIYSILEGFTITNGDAKYGAGINCTSGSNPTITNCIFTNNSVRYHGGGIYNEYTSPTLTNCTFNRNSADISGGGIYYFQNNKTKVINCIFWGNTPEEISVSGEAPQITYSDVQGGWSGEGNIDVDPYFADPNNGDYHLKSQAGRWDQKAQTWVTDDVTSPCIDVGNPGSPLEEELLSIPDRLNYEIYNSRINMGAYGGTSEASFAPYNWTLLPDLTNNGIVNLEDFAIFAKYWKKTGNEQPADLNRDDIVNTLDFVLFTQDWLEKAIQYKTKH